VLRVSLVRRLCGQGTPSTRAQAQLSVEVRRRVDLIDFPDHYMPIVIFADLQTVAHLAPHQRQVRENGT
jgi:hypothetical protein